MVEELTEEANIAADGSLFVQQLRRKRGDSDNVSEEDEDPPSSVLQAVQRTLMLQADALCLLGCPVALQVRIQGSTSSCHLHASVLSHAIGCSWSTDSTNCSPAVAAFTSGHRCCGHE